MAEFKIDGYTLKEKIYDQTNTIVYKGKRDSDLSNVIVKILKKEYPEPELVAPFKQEYEIMNMIDSPNIIKCHDLLETKGRLVIILEDYNASALQILFDKKTKPNLNDFFHIAIEIVKGIDVLHENGIIHKDLNFANILFNPKSKELKVIDFGISSKTSREKPSISNPNVLEGTLPYISPEQTGRMNRVIDYRTDFYSLGVVLYRLSTGILPFDKEDPMELIHCHLAETPKPPKEMDSNIPLSLSFIVTKLLEKTAERRYQNALAIIHDLEKCRELFSQGKIDETFKLGETDFSDKFQISGKIYGRENEIKKLIDSFNEVSQKGDARLMLVAGYSGIGKSSVIEEIHKPITSQKGFFVSGKFDQYKKDVPYSAFIQAFQELIRFLLVGQESELENWKKIILNALGENGNVIVEVIPELEIIIGKQPPLSEVSVAEAKNRFNFVFTEFINIFSQKKHPLVIFLDDLQWADVASLDLMELLMTRSSSSYLFLIGAYRDNEVNASSPLTLTLDSIKNFNNENNPDEEIIQEILLTPLSLETVQEILSDSLHSNPNENKEFAELIWKKTGGNPFFINEFLKTLYKNLLINFDKKQLKWTWDIPKILQQNITDNVVELMSSKIQELPTGSKIYLSIAACLGNKFDLNSIALLKNVNSIEIASNLDQCIQEGFVFPIGAGHKKLLNSKVELNEKIEYKFVHDRIQQAAYYLLSEIDRKELHIRIGFVLYDSYSEKEREEKIFEIVNHLNYSDLESLEEENKNLLIKLNLNAAKKAKSSTAYNTSYNFLSLCLKLLGQNSWEKKFDLSYDINLSLAEISYLTLRFAECERIAQLVIEKSKESLDKMAAYQVLIDSFKAQNKAPEAVVVAWKAVAMMGIKLPDNPGMGAVFSSLIRLNLALIGKKPEELENLPAIEDPEFKAASSMLLNVSSAAYTTSAEKWLLINLTVIRLALKFGISPSVGFSCSGFGMVLAGVLGDIEKGIKFVELADKIVKKFNGKEFFAKVKLIQNFSMQHWKNHLKLSLPNLLNVYKLGREVGDLEYSSYGVLVHSYHSMLIGVNLIELEESMIKFRDSIIEMKQELSLYRLVVYLQTVQNLLGKNESPTVITGKYYDEEKSLEFVLKAGDKTSAGFFYVNKIFLSYQLEAPIEEQIKYADIAVKYLEVLPSLPLTPLLLFYDALIRLRAYEALKKGKYLRQAKSTINKFKKWSTLGKENYLHKYYILLAEYSRIQNPQKNNNLYELAIKSAREYGYIHEEALAYRLGANYYLGIQKENIAFYYNQNSYFLYEKWGGVVITRLLEQKFGSSIKTKNDPGKISTTISGKIGTKRSYLGTESVSSSLDQSTILKSSQIISEEINLANLVQKVTHIAKENAGATYATLFYAKDQQLYFAENSLPLSNSNNDIPVSIIQYVKRTKEALVIGNALIEEKFRDEAYIQTNKTKSILCMPLLKQRELVGILYLENNASEDVFTKDRVEVLNILGAQAAISIENARLFDSMQRLNEANQKFVPTPLLSILEKESITDLKLGDQTQKEMAILFSDIRDFTSISEKLSPQENFNFINSYLSRMGPHVRKNHGFIDKYIGDAVMALFPHRPEDAIQSGIDMQREVILYNVHRAKQGYKPISIGIGIHTGSLMLGIIGELERMEGTVISDAVNLASRLEGLTKMYGISLMISEDTLMKVEHIEQYKYRLLDNVVVKGKQTSIRVYQVFEGLGSEEEDLLQITKLSFELGIESYINKRFEEALELFENVVKQNPKDYPTQLYINRCKIAIKEGVSDDWTGVTKFTEK